MMQIITVSCISDILQYAVCHFLKLESGIDIRYIQELLGHNSSKTTEIYTYVSTKNIERIKSPLDDLNI